MSIMMTPGKVMYNLGSIERIPLGEGRTFRVGEEVIALFRTRQGDVRATQASCPHKNGPLADGIVGNGQVICPLHAYRFHLETGAPLGHNCGELRVYPVSVDGNDDILLVLEE